MSSLDHALRYAVRGWPVFPLIPGRKAPATKRGFLDANADVDQITEWWTTNPSYGIGMPTGIAFDVLDVDHVDFVSGVADLPDCETAGGPVVRTGSGKWHVYLLPTGTKRRIRFSEHCDWLGKNGYVIAPPSIHPDTGRPYEWVAPDTLALTDAPAELLAALNPPAVPLATSPLVRAVQRHEATRRYSGAGLVGRLTMAVRGERNQVLNWAAHRVGFDVHDHKVSAADAVPVLDELDRAARLIGLDDKEIERSIRSGYTAGVAGRVANPGAA